MINTPASYSGGPVFNGPVTYPDWCFSWFFPVPSGKYWHSALN
jgi:hypothetical protein